MFKKRSSHPINLTTNTATSFSCLFEFLLCVCGVETLAGYSLDSLIHSFGRNWITTVVFSHVYVQNNT